MPVIFRSLSTVQNGIKVVGLKENGIGYCTRYKGAIKIELPIR